MHALHCVQKLYTVAFLWLFLLCVVFVSCRCCGVYIVYTFSHCLLYSLVCHLFVILLALYFLILVKIYKGGCISITQFNAQAAKCCKVVGSSVRIGIYASYNPYSRLKGYKDYTYQERSILLPREHFHTTAAAHSAGTPYRDKVRRSLGLCLSPLLLVFLVCGGRDFLRF